MIIAIGFVVNLFSSLASANHAEPSILKLVSYSDPILRQIAAPVHFPLSEDDKQLIANMKYSIQPEQLKQVHAAWEAAAGMAANQWGVGKRIFIFSPNGNSAEELEVIINPSYIPLDAEGLILQDDAWEACFSIPLAVGHISRFTRIQVKYQNEAGEFIEKELHGWAARVWQHENDHLNGTLYDDADAKKCKEKRIFSSKAEVDDFYQAIREERKRAHNNNDK
jgi:peptide deformylase